MDLGLRNRAFIVTGASGGIGGAVVEMLAHEGASVLLVGRREAPLRSLAESCGAFGRAEPLALDITSLHAGERLAAECEQRFGRIDGLVNGAGTTAARSLEELTDDDWQRQWELNVLAPMRLMRAAAPRMADRGFGRIVNVCSSSGKRPSSTNVAYSVSKAAELSLSRAFADLYASRGVLVNAVAPGPVADDVWLAPGGLADELAQRSGASREEVLANTASRVPLARLATAQEIAAVVVFLCSELASNVAGAAWSVDGGSVPVII
ncbi:MAG: SDR family oxidoreductase [Solirubrobacterales bacterium]|nr:SDR family oxidoreductase [Solirubrobacterales bacterium]